jgi:hypothetical protein
MEREIKMSDRYSTYTRLTLDYPSKRILRLTFNRPETYNSVDAETHTQLTNIWRDINDDPDINAVIVTGAGKAFSAGGDFELIKSILDNPVVRMATWKEAKDLVYNVINCNKPIISAMSRSARVSLSAYSRTFRSRESRPASSTVIRDLALRPAMSPALFGLCCAALRKRNIIF